MPSHTLKRKSNDAHAPPSKKSKPDASAPTLDRKKLAPLGQREISRRAPPGSHARKKDGSCRQKCRTCKSEQFEWDALNKPDHCFHSLYTCRAKGRDGSPTFDKAGYELDYDKVLGWFEPMTHASAKLSAAQMGRKEARWAREREEEQRMLDDFFEDGAAPRLDASDFSLVTVNALKDKVEKDTGILWHRIGPAEVREWRNKGFPRAKQGECQKFDQEESRRLGDKSTGCLYRK